MTATPERRHTVASGTAEALGLTATVRILTADDERPPRIRVQVHPGRTLRVVDQWGGAREGEQPFVDLEVEQYDDRSAP